jgi:hypothetical protein
MFQIIARQRRAFAIEPPDSINTKNPADRPIPGSGWYACATNIFLIDRLDLETRYRDKSCPEILVQGSILSVHRPSGYS